MEVCGLDTAYSKKVMASLKVRLSKMREHRNQLLKRPEG
jgi:hypothetical protein